MRSAMVSYFVAEACAGRGLATRAVAELVEHGFGEVGLHRLEAATAVLERNGFTRIGLMRSHLLLQGAWVDHHLWERIVGD